MIGALWCYPNCLVVSGPSLVDFILMGMLVDVVDAFYLSWEVVQWGVFPRLKVWTMKDMLIASKEDRAPNRGDYGCKGTLDVAYGEIHPRQARDTDGPGVVTKEIIEHDIDFTATPRRRRGASSSKIPRQEAGNTYAVESASVVAVVSEEPNQTHGKLLVRSDGLPHVGYLDDWRRFLPTGALSLLRKMILGVMSASNYCIMGDWPLILSSAFLQVVSFDGQLDYNIVMLPLLSTFICNPRCSMLLVVSEDCGRTLSSDLALYRICIPLTISARYEMMLLSADSITPDISSISRPLSWLTFLF
ncbi:uncharacterized protein LOC110686841 [Chenopodium quinoa]|uniref:uncharacterized protein LOC110686841 n=1 Tax=Chenopodium quinoa TaxID=63459 RepID=UPI000B788F09|nr:uncharacterized protein LOC110686841 [Chenopodium quinoa]XP_021719130.1 uncharacterized protein LOC110686841 [Chenopodium quinoa]